MLLNHFKIAFRSLLKFKGYAAINMTGLGLGLTAGILVMIYVFDELSYDTFHSERDRIYRVETSFFTPTSGAGEKSMDANGWGVGNVLKGFPEVESVAYLRNASMLLVNHGGKRIKEQIHFASPEFFGIFSFPLSEGNIKTALSDPYSIVLTKTLADKYFPGESALNKSITLADTLQFVVTGIMPDVPGNSHMQFNALISFSTFTTLFPFDYDGGWGNINIRNYLLVKEGADVSALREKARMIYFDKAGESLKNWGIEAYVHLAPLNGLYLTTESGNGMGPLGSIDRLYLLSGIAVFVIILACINFINLTTARSVYRAKEVGLKKVIGSSRSLLIRQFLSESLLTTVLAFVLSLTFSGLLLPLFNQLIGKQYEMNALLTPPVIVGILVLIVCVTLLAGYYPAIVLSRLKPADILKGRMQTGSRGVQLRRTLVVFQFAISVTLLLGTFIVIRQLTFMQGQELGFAKDEILVVNAARARSISEDGYQAFKNDISDLSVVEDVTFTNSLPGNPGWSGQVSYAEERSSDQSISVEYMAIDENYLNTLNLALKTGNNFSKERPGEMQDGLILNEKAASMYGWASAEEAIGKKIESPSGYPRGVVIGVVKDYHQFGLKHEIGPMAMDYNPSNSYLYGIRFKGSDTKDLLTRIEGLWKKHFPGYDFNYFFLDDDFAKQYDNEQRLATVFGIFAAITILIAVIGLLGLVSFMVITRTKEIGVRKVLGADVLSITSLLSKEFLILVVIGNLIAFPIVWYFANEWLMGFATHTVPDVTLFAATFIIALTITLLTISIQTVKAAVMNPAKALRYE
jgi:putative ABC transport system permease protein